MRSSRKLHFAALIQVFISCLLLFFTINAQGQGKNNQEDMMTDSQESIVINNGEDSSVLPPRCESKMIMQEGRPRLSVNGKLVPEVFFLTTPIAAGKLDVIPDVVKSGFQIAAIPIWVSSSKWIQKNTGGYKDFIWLGDHQYDFGALDRRLNEVWELGQNIKVHLYLVLEPPDSWAQTHPEEIVVYNDNGTNNGISDCGDKGSLFTPSLASKCYIDDMQDLLTKLIEHIDRQSYRDRFFGINLVGGHDGQWYWKIPRTKSVPLLADYSKAMQRYFLQYLRRKYMNDISRLQDAWNNPEVTFDNIAIPSIARRNGSGNFEFRDPAKDQDVIDYTEAYAQAPVDLILALAHTVKKASHGRAFVTVYSGSCAMDLDENTQAYGRLLQSQLLESPDLDGIVGVTYAQRPLSEPDALALVFGSLRLHNKLGIEEQDIRTYLSTRDSDKTLFLYGYTPNWDLQRNVLVRKFGRLLTTGAGTWYYDMHYGWFSAPEFWNLFKNFQAIRAEEMQKPFASKAEIALIVDDESQFYLPRFEGYLQLNAIAMQRAVLGWLGAPYDVYFLRDLLNQNMPSYKCYLFANTFRIDSDIKDKIHQRLKEQHATAIWLYASGIICDGKLDLENIKKLTGFDVKEVISPSKTVKLCNFIHPVIGDLAGKSYGKPLPMEIPPWGIVPTYLSEGGFPSFRGGKFYSPQAETNTIVLGDMEATTDIPGLAIKNMDGWTSIFSAGLVLSPELLRNILRFSGGFIYSDEPYVSVCANNNYISVYARDAGIKTIKLPEEGTLCDLFSKEIIGTGKSFNVKFKQFEARVFTISKSPIQANENKKE